MTIPMLSMISALADLARNPKRRVRRLHSHFKLGRNTRCPCGSGRKYKQCCLIREGD